MSDDTKPPEPVEVPKLRAQKITPLQIRAGDAIRAGAKSTRAAIIEAGGSPWTADAPRRNGLTADRLVRASKLAEIAGETTLRSLKPAATQRLRGILADQDESASVVAQTALAVHRISAEIGESEEAPGERESERLALTRLRVEALARGLRRALGRSPELVARWLSRLGRIAAALDADTAALDADSRESAPILAPIRERRGNADD